MWSMGRRRICSAFVPRGTTWTLSGRTRPEYCASSMSRGSNGYVKTKYVTLTIEAENLPAARARFARIETDTLNRFQGHGGRRPCAGRKRAAGAASRHPPPRQTAAVRRAGSSPSIGTGWRPAAFRVKDFIAPSSFHFGETRTFRIGEMYGAVSFLQITAPEIHDRILAEFMETEGNILVTMHIRGINQNEAIKMVKRKITDLDAMKIAEQKRAVRSGYDMDILPQRPCHLRRRGKDHPPGSAKQE